jgi:hypothetical protein
MLVQWRYKVCKRFARQGSEIITGVRVAQIAGSKPRPMGLFLYKPSKRKYDYVDYTGSYRRNGIDASDATCYLELLGLIKFVEKVQCDERTFA